MAVPHKSRRILAYVSLSVAFIATVFVLHGVNQKATGAADLACEATNNSIAQSNVASGVAFKAYASAVKREEALAKSSSGSVRDAHVESADISREFASKLVLVPITDCHFAASDPGAYELSPPVRIGVNLVVEVEARAIINQSEDLIHP